MDYVDRTLRKSDRIQRSLKTRIIGFQEKRKKDVKMEPGFQSLGMTKNRSRCVKGSHDGQRCFIIASGPSLETTDLEWLKNEITIGVNGIPKYLNNRYGWAPTYNVITDANVEWCPKLLNITEKHGRDVTKLVISSYVANRFKDRLPKNHIFTVQYPNSNTRSSQGGVINHFLDERPHVAGAGGYVVSDTAVQLAMFLGCNPIYLVGQDHTTEQSVVPLKKGERTHGKAAKDISTCTFLMLREYAKQRNFRIFNATQVQNLKVFPFVDLGSLRDKPALSLDMVKDIHKGQRGFLIRSGKSIRRLQLIDLCKDITISIGNSYLDLGAWNLAPTWACLDEQSPKTAYVDLHKLGTCILAPEGALARYGVPGFPLEQLEGYGTDLATRAALPLATLLGFDPIMLAGFDQTPGSKSYDINNTISKPFSVQEIKSLHNGLLRWKTDMDALQRRVIQVSGDLIDEITKIPFTHFFRAGPVYWDL